MKRAVLKLAFYLTFFIFLIALLVPWLLLLQVMLPDGRTAGGHYQSNGAAVLLVALGAAMATLIADRCASHFFKWTGLSGHERWSMSKRRSRP